MGLNLALKRICDDWPIRLRENRYDQSSQMVEYIKLPSAYKQGHITEAASLKVQNDLMAAVDKRIVSLFIFLDLSSAF